MSLRDAHGAALNGAGLVFSRVVGPMQSDDARFGGERFDVVVDAPTGEGSPVLFVGNGEWLRLRSQRGTRQQRSRAR